MSSAASNRVQALAHTLQDTNQNLRAVERMLRDISEERKRRMSRPSSANASRDRPPVGSRSHGRPHSAMPASFLTSDREAHRDARETGSAGDLSGRRFTDDMAMPRLDGRNIQDVRQSLHDLSAEHKKMADDLARERERRLQASQSLATADVEALERVDRRLQKIDDDLRAERSERQTRHEDVIQVSAELKQALEKQRRREAELSGEEARRRDDAEKAQLRLTLNQQAEQLREYLQGTVAQRQAEQDIQNLKIQISQLNRPEARGASVGDMRESRLDGYTREIADIQRRLDASNSRNDELQRQHKETVKLLKMKNQKIQSECDQYKQRNEKVERQNREVLREHECQKSRLMAVQQQVDHLLREFNDLMALRVDLDEKLSVRDSVVSELTYTRDELEKELRDSRATVEALERDLSVTKEREHSARVATEKESELLRALEQLTMCSDQTERRMSKDLHEITAAKAELASSLAVVVAENEQLRNGFAELKKVNVSAAEEVDALRKKVRDSENDARHQDTIRRYRKERAELLAEVEGMKLAVEEERSINQLQKRQELAAREELDHVCEELSRARDECAAVEQKYHRLQRDIAASALKADDGLSQRTSMEQELADARDKLVRAARDHDNDLTAVCVDVDAVMRIIYGDDWLTSQNVESWNPQIKNDRLLSLRQKLSILKRDLWKQSIAGEKGHKSKRDDPDSADEERQFLLTEINRQRDTMDHLSGDRQMGDSRPGRTGSKSPGRSTSRSRSPPRSRPRAVSPTTERKKRVDVNREQEEINAKYDRLKKSVVSLKKDLSNARVKESRATGGSGYRNTGIQNRKASKLSS